MTVDSIKLTGDISLILNYRLSLFTRDQSQKQNVIIRDVYRSPEDLILGLKNITLDNLTGRFTVEVSAKILGADYYDNININNIERVIDIINSTGIIEINKSRIADIGVLRVDICDNIEVEKSKDKYLNSLWMYKYNDKFNCDTQYIKKGTIIFTANKAKDAERISVYDKKFDMNKAKNRELQELLFLQGRLNQFDNVLRVEQNVKTFSSMRQIIGVNTTIENGAKIIDILQSKKRCNFNLLNSIVEEPPPSLFKEYEGMKFCDEEKYRGRKDIFKDYNNDYDKVIEYVKYRVKGNIKRYKDDYKEAYQRMMRDANLKDHYEIDNCISEILNKLA